VGNSIPGWTIQDGFGASIHNNAEYPFISGNYSLNTDAEGLNSHNVNIYQDFASATGEEYTFSFDWLTWFLNSTPRLDVSIVDTVSNTVLVSGNYAALPGLHNESFNFLGTGNLLRLRIQHNPESAGNDNTFIVDNFSVQLVPAPGAAALMGVGSMLGSRRRRDRGI
jgi:hypothetical protein